MLEVTSFDDLLYAETQGRVQTGPFAGMTLLREQAWSDGALSPMLLGCHEEELHKAIENEITRLNDFDRQPIVVNIGCAEGYYAIGFARRVPQAIVYAIDINDKCLELSKKTASINEVTLVTGEELDVIFEHPDTIISDCEGAEVLYLDMEHYPGLRNTTIIVELHMMGEQNTPEILHNRFAATHEIEFIIEGPRNPNKFDFLHQRPSAFRWKAVCENRPCLMAWFVMRPK
jgi:Methyltransferase small domain